MAADNLTTTTTLQSILAADFGSVNTRIILVDLVDGQYRLVSRTQTPTTMNSNINDVTVGLTRAVENLQRTTGRQLIDSDGLLIFPEQADGSGVDEIVATTSAARPLKAVLIGLMRDVSMDTALRALAGSYIEVAASISISDDKTEEEQLNDIVQATPDLIFITGGTDGGDLESMRTVIDTVYLAIQLLPTVPVILYAGNVDLAEYVFEKLRIEDLNNDVLIAPNIRPSLDNEDLETARLELALAYNNFVTSQPGGFNDIAIVSKVGIVPTAQSISNIMHWLSDTERDTIGALHFDIGSANSSLIVALGDRVSSNVQNDLGMGHSMAKSISQIRMDRVQDWLPFQIGQEALVHYAHNKTLIPDTIPQSEDDLMIEYAFVREIMRYLAQTEKGTWRHLSKAEAVPNFDPIIVSGATLAEAAHPGITAMLVIDALDIEGITNIYVDPFSLLPALGAIALLEPTVTVQVFENQALTNIGPVFCATGSPRSRGKKPGMRIKITLESGRMIEHDLEPGHIWAAPISSGQEATVQIRLARGLKLDGKTRLKHKVIAGAAGIIFDARGRSIKIPSIENRAETFNTWWQGVSGSPLPKWERWARADFSEKPIESTMNQRELDNLNKLVEKSLAGSVDTEVDEE